MTLFQRANLVLPDRVEASSFLLVDAGQIVALGAEAETRARSAGADRLDCEGLFLAPGYIDLHVHGGGGADFMDATRDAVQTVIETHTRHGTTGLYPTTLSADLAEIHAVVALLEAVAADPTSQAEILGIHLEGPYLCAAQKGAQDERYLLAPTPQTYLPLLASPLVKRVSFAPELDGAAALMEALRDRGIVGSLAHTEASHGQVVEAVERGASLVTHLYSGMNGVHRQRGLRRVGVVESSLLLDELAVELIADGRHLPAELLRLVPKIKGTRQTILVTDAMRGAGTSAKTSVLGSLARGQPVELRDGVAWLPDGSALAGSTATMDRLVQNMVKLAGWSVADAVAMATLSPARAMGIDHRRGSLAVGKHADLVLLNAGLGVEHVFVKGVRAPR